MERVASRPPAFLFCAANLDRYGISIANALGQDGLIS
jgi:hypothetical protein